MKGSCYVVSEFAFPCEANHFRMLTLQANQGAYLLYDTNQDGTAFIDVPVDAGTFYFWR